MKILKLDDLPLHDLGNNIEISGMILQGQGKTYAVMLPKADVELPQLVKVDHDEWKKLLHQLDTLEVKLFPNNPESKVIVRKSQRNIEQNVSWNVFRRDQYKCRYCGVDNVPLTVDHIVLWEDMGPSVEDNLNTACKKCNKTRGNIPYTDWLVSEYYVKVGAVLSASEKFANIEAWSKAAAIPLRVSKRNR